MANAFDQFDASPTPPSPKAPAGNAFDAFDAAPTGADEKAPGPIRFKSAAQLAEFRKDHPEQKGLSDAEFLDWFGKSRTTPTTAVLDNAPPAPAAPTDNSALKGFIYGARDFGDRLEHRIDQIPGLGAVGNWLEAHSPFTAPGEAERQRATHATELANNSRTGWQTVGQIAASIPLSRLPGGILAQGAATGAIMSDAEDGQGVAMDAAKGAAFSKLAGVGFKSLGGLATGVKNAGARALHDAGIDLTIGQLGRAAGNLPGKIAAGIEDRLAGFPIVGDIVNAARDRGTLAYNKSVLGRALNTVGEKIPEAIKHGHEMVAYVGDRLSEKYQQLLPKLSAKFDVDFLHGVNDARKITATLPDSRKAQFESILYDALHNRMDPATIQAVAGGKNLPAVINTLPGAYGSGAASAAAGKAQPSLTLSSTMLKDAESKLNRLATQYRKSMDVDQQRLGEAIGVVRDHLRDLVERQNPAHKGELQALNKGWAQLATAETAAARQGNTTGIFTPKGYAAAARAADNSVRKRATARGQYPNQAITDAAADILPNHTPDSGTAGRASLGLAGLLTGGGTAALTAHPVLAAGAGAATIPFTRIGQQAMNRIAFANRPLALRGAAIPLNQLAKYAPALVAPLAVSPKQ